MPLKICFILILSLVVTTASGQPALEPAAPVIPIPTGPHSIGTAIFHLVDSSRLDFVTRKPGQFNELMVQAWYPSGISGTFKPAPYVSDRAILQEMIRQKFPASSELINSFALVNTHSALNAPLLKDDHPLPLLLGLPGLGFPRFFMTSLAEDLASHGYLVVCIDNPYNFAVQPDGRVQTTAQDNEADQSEAYSTSRTESWAKDASFVVSAITDPYNPIIGRFASRIDKSRIGIFGHSIGGAVAVEACRIDARFKAAIDMDGLPFGKVASEGFSRPTAIFASHVDQSDADLAKRGRTREQWEEMGRQRKALWAPIFAASKSRAYWVLINGTNHSHFSDIPFIWPEAIARFGGRIIDPNRGFEIITTYMREFFGQYLRDAGSKLLTSGSKQYPEVTVTIYDRSAG
jgi:predicted dienelactone hydrolase